MHSLTLPCSIVVDPKLRETQTLPSRRSEYSTKDMSTDILQQQGKDLVHFPDVWHGIDGMCTLAS